MDTNKLIPSLSDMAIFVTVVEQGNFSKAAKKLGVTPSAVSRQISRLEDALGIKLLQRTTRQLALTESGKITFNYCKQMIESAVQAVNASRSATSTVSGLLSKELPIEFKASMTTMVAVATVRNDKNLSTQTVRSSLSHCNLYC